MDKVLVVDDEPDILKLITENLQVRGYKVSQAMTATDALQHLSDDPPGLMLLDIKLPDFTGWELLERIQDDPNIDSSFPVLIMTASITDSNTNLHAYPTVVDILIKPFSISHLISAVKQTLQNPRIRS